jgi:hypothetical protein
LRLVLGEEVQCVLAGLGKQDPVAVGDELVSVLWPDWLCARPGDRAAVHGGRQRR